MSTDKDEAQKARDRLDALTRKYRDAKAVFEEAQAEVSDEIVRILKARTLGPSEVTRHSPFERQHVGRIAKAANIPPLREPTVVSAKKKTPANA